MKKYILNGLVIFCLLGIITATSCRTSRVYQIPEVDTEGLFREVNPTDSITIASIPWREYFTDPILKGLIEEGLANNHDLRVAFTRIQQAEANLNMAKAAYFPNVALAGQVTKTFVSNGVRGKDVLGYTSSDYSLGIAATWELDIWGKLRGQNRAQYAAFLNSHAYRNLIQTSLIANIATSYYSLLALDEQLEITKETIGLLLESTQTMQALMDAGMLTGASVEQSKALYYNTQITVPNLESQIRSTENSLSVLLGRKPGAIERSDIEAQTVYDGMNHGIPMQMLARRPDVQQAELSFRSAFELTRSARAALYPSLTLGNGSMFGFAASTLSGFFKPENLLANVIGGLTMPIFAQGQLRGSLKIRKAQQEEALLTFEKTVLSAGQEVSDILFGYKASLSKNGIRNKQIEALNNSVYFTQELLKAGESNYTEVLTAQQSLLSAQLSQVSDKLEQLQYSVTLYKALGGGIE